MTPSQPDRFAILYFSSFASAGWGGQESLWHLMSRLDRRKFRPVVVLPQAGSLSKRLLEHGLKVRFVELPRIAPTNIRCIIHALRNLLCVIDQERIDILHTDGPRNTLYAGMAGKLKRKPVVWHVRTSMADPYDRFLCRLCSKIILVADCLVRRFRFSSQKKKLITIHNGVDVDQFVPEAGKRRTERCLGLRPDDLVITVSARIEPLKGQHYVIEACGHLHRFLPRLQLVFAGEIFDQAYQRACIQRAYELGVAEHVRFMGHVENIGQLLQHTDIFVLPSETEAFPRAVLEAMSSGLPVVATDCGGTREAVVNDVCGFLVQPKNSLEIAQRIAVLIEDTVLRSRMGRAGRKIAVERFGIERNVTRTEDVYRQIVQVKDFGHAFAIQSNASRPT